MVPRTVLASIVVMLALPSVAHGATWGVNDTVDTPVGQACPGFTGCSLRQAVTSAELNPGDDAVLVAPGTYPLPNGQLTVTQNLEVAKVGAGVATIQGSGSRLFDVTGGTLAIRFLTLTGGSASGRGGAIDAAAGTTVSIESSTISNSTASGTAAASGGAIHSLGDLSLGTASGSTTGTTITGNSVTATDTNAVASGGGVTAEGTLAIGARTTISNNTATASTAPSRAEGGGVFALNGATVTQTTLSGNTAEGGTAQGGGLAVAMGTGSVVRSTVSGNIVRGTQGGGVVNGGGGVVALASGSADLSLQSSTVANNTVTTTSTSGSVVTGGGVANLRSSGGLTATNSTIVGNASTAPSGSSASAGGITVNGGVATLGATILAENTQTGSASECTAGTITSQGYTLLGNVSTCVYNAGTGDVTGVTNAGLRPLANYGGLTQTLMLDDGSPALDIVPAADALCTTQSTDQRGISRPQSGNCDSGAVEARPATASLTPNPRSFPDAAPGGSSTANMALSNAGDLTLTLTSLSFGGSDPSQFSVNANSCTTVAPGSNCIFSLRFSPTSNGAKTATVTADTDHNDPSATLNGSGVSPIAQLAPASHDFGSVTSGTTALFDFTLSNAGNVDLAITGISLSGGDAGQFGTTNPCQAALSPGASCTIHTTFSPLGSGARSTTLTVTSDGGTQSATLSGTATQPEPMPPTPPDPTPPTPTGPSPIPPPAALVLTDLSISPKTVASGNPAVAFSLSRAATVAYRVDRVLEGKTRRGRCTITGASRKSGPRCIRYDQVGGPRTAAGVSFANRYTLDVSGLGAGRYRLRVTARSGADATPERSVRFRIT